MTRATQQPDFDFEIPLQSDVAVGATDIPNDQGDVVDEQWKGQVATMLAPGHYWREVPAALFLSWSDVRQLDYCARRDEDAMRGENVSEW